MDFSRNNLATASSPYLRQHAENPVWWQEWGPEVLQHARETDKVLLVSVGYSTCHWCHVMAHGAFSHQQCAQIINRDFVAIKVDREQRPDIDEYLMSFLVATTGAGGWPLNAFLTPNGDPFFAMTFAAAEPRLGVPALTDVLVQVQAFYRERKSDIRPFNLPNDGGERSAASVDTDAIVRDWEDDTELSRLADTLERAFDAREGGFGTSHKFPPHSTLLFMLYAAAGSPELAQKFGSMSRSTLDAMANRGLHDHLGGGFFRYCVDREWKVPHFEKMLYDQAMMLWSFSLGARLTADQRYAETARGVFRCLEESFRIDNFYASAHDADTTGTEGGTYLWTRDEIAAALSDQARTAFFKAYELHPVPGGNGTFHLHRRPVPLPRGEPSHTDATERMSVLREAERTLLAARRGREQPFRDDKILVGWNALTACALVSAHRLIGIPGALGRAQQIAAGLLREVSSNGTLPHEVGGPRGEAGGFLADYASLLVLLHMLAEEGAELGSEIDHARTAVLRFHEDGRWVESSRSDFRPVPARAFDQPLPSGVALAEAGLLRGAIAKHMDYEPQRFVEPLAGGFRNVTALIGRGYFYVVDSPGPVPWDRLPANSVRVRGETLTHCYRNVCKEGLPPEKTGKNANR